MPVYSVSLVESHKTSTGKTTTRVLLSANHTAPNALVLRNKLTPSAKRVFGSELGSRIRLIIKKVK
jgi:hypothetical protein